MYAKADVTHAARASFIFSRLAEGSVRRGDLMLEYGVSKVTASAIFGRFQETYPDAMVYNVRRGAYLPGIKFLKHYEGVTAAAQFQ